MTKESTIEKRELQEADTGAVSTSTAPSPAALRAGDYSLAPGALKETKSKTNFFGKTLGALLALSLTVIGSELLLAVTGLGEEEYVRPDPLFGVAHMEGKDVTFKAEGFSRGKFNSAGLRDREFTVSKPDHTRRIAFLGDSKTEGMQVPMEETFVKLLESRLNKNTDMSEAAHAGKAAPDVQAINFATAGNGTLVELLHYLTRVRYYKPDTTVLIYNYGDSGESGSSGAVNNALARPAVFIEADGSLRLSFDELDHWLASDNTRFKQDTAWLRRHSRLFQMGSDIDLNMRGQHKVYTAFSDSVLKPGCTALSKVLAAATGSDKKARAQAKTQAQTQARALSQAQAQTQAQQTASPAGQAGLTEQALHERAYLQAEFARLDKLVNSGKASVLPARPERLDKDARSIESLGFAAIDQEHHRNTELTAKLLRMLHQACLENGSKLVVVGLPAPDNCTFYFWELRALKNLAGEFKDGNFTVVDCNPSFPKLKPMEVNPYYYTAHFSPVGHKIIADIIEPYLQPSH
ncbi:MAG: hypothetical protein IPK73_25335 [Candidatus Obscuribacter sp.]|nr:hypothetical protein [Candidatus Obscuribacter sp.]MBK9277444.1 hypothetical protein [Candidatus Obscuribacter sp.]